MGLSVFQLMRFGAGAFMAVFAIGWGIIEMLRGKVGSEDVTFQLFHVSRQSPRMITVINVRDAKLRPLLDNAFLSLCASYWLLRHKGLLLAKKASYQRILMSTFRDVWSTIMNGEKAEELANSPEITPTKFVFCVTSIKSNSGRLKMRPIAIREEDLEAIRMEGVESLIMKSSDEYARNVIKHMLAEPRMLDTFSAFRPKQPKSVVHETTVKIGHLTLITDPGEVRAAMRAYRIVSH